MDDLTRRKFIKGVVAAAAVVAIPVAAPFDWREFLREAVRKAQARHPIKRRYKPGELTMQFLHVPANRYEPAMDIPYFSCTPTPETWNKCADALMNVEVLDAG